MPYKYSRIVVTCGVSMFGGANTYRKWAEEQGLLVFPSPSPNPVPPSGKSEQQALDDWKRRCERPGSGGPPESDTKRISAEYTLLCALKSQGRLTYRPHTVLIHTDSLGGRAAAQMLSVLIRREFDSTVNCSEIRMDVADREALRYDLGNFMQTVALHLRDQVPNSTCFAPLGGYKVMTSLGYLAGAYFRVPTLYTHEDSQIVHEIPAVPVGIPRVELEKVAPTMKRIGNGCDVLDLSESESVQLTEYSWLFERTDSIASVNAFGLFLMQESGNAELFATKVHVSETVEREYRTDRRLRLVLQQLAALAGKLAASSPEPNLTHEMGWLPAAGSRHLYKGASNGELVFRCIYSYGDGGLRIGNAWTSHDKYEAEVENAWRDEITAHIDWSSRIVQT